MEIFEQAAQDENVAQLVEPQIQRPADAGSTHRCGKEFFSHCPLSVQIAYGARTPPCAMAYSHNSYTYTR